jgi:hypothetical protein
MQQTGLKIVEPLKRATAGNMHIVQSKNSQTLPRQRQSPPSTIPQPQCTSTSIGTTAGSSPRAS